MTKSNFLNRKISIKVLLIAFLIILLSYGLFLIVQGHTIPLNRFIVKKQIESQLLENYDIQIASENLETSDIVEYKDYALMFYHTDSGYGAITLKTYYKHLFFVESFIYQSNEVLYDYFYFYPNGHLDERMLAIIGQYNDQTVSSIYYSNTLETENLSVKTFGVGQNYYYYFGNMPTFFSQDSFSDIVVNYS